ncbi:hypothetical protein GCM10010228_54560 [Streptomyces massasporeus]|nr:hypothetical protein GCM10010228_54560 [Streptomyces massasporeus]
MPSRPGAIVAAPHSPPPRATADAPGTMSTPTTTPPTTAAVLLYLFIAGGAPCPCPAVEDTPPTILTGLPPGGTPR